nr:MAG TPA: hypothetical protein [Caudoviricetes sp.]
MSFIKNNQVLEIKIAYDDDACFFDDFIQDSGLERISDYQWIVIKNPGAKRFTADDLKNAESVQDFMNELDLSVIDRMDLTDKEAESLYHSLNMGLFHDVEIARKGLLSLPFIEWYASLNDYVGGEDWEKAMTDFKNIARGDCGEYAEIYIQGMTEEDSDALTEDFETYAYKAPYYFTIDLIDAESGDTIGDDSLGGIYDDSYQLEYLFLHITESLDNMPNLNKELRDMAVNELSKMDYSSIEW